MPNWLWPNGSTSRPRLSGEGTPAQSEADFGPRKIGKGFHDGTDFAHYFSNVTSVGDGVVSKVEVWNGKTSMQHGNRVYVDHGGGVVSSYSHLASVRVNKGDRVSAGHVLGPMGYTGFVTGAHLHLEVRVNGALVDPVAFLSARIGGSTASSGSTPFEEDDVMNEAQEKRLENVEKSVKKLVDLFFNGQPETDWKVPMWQTLFDSAVRIRGVRVNPDGTDNHEYPVGDVLQWIRDDIRNRSAVVDESAVADRIVEKLAAKSGASAEEVRGIVVEAISGLTLKAL